MRPPPRTTKFLFTTSSTRRRRRRAQDETTSSEDHARLMSPERSTSPNGHEDPRHIKEFKNKIIKEHNNSNRPIIIFPQATRVDVLDRSPFKKGVKRIYEELNIFCQPVALNSGSVWPKSGRLISNKTITISILEKIPVGLNSEDFLRKLENQLYNELEKII